MMHMLILLVRFRRDCRNKSLTCVQPDLMLCSVASAICLLFRSGLWVKNITCAAYRVEFSVPFRSYMVAVVIFVKTGDLSALAMLIRLA